MGFRFQKRIKVLPGVTLNLSKSGLSTSIGTRGAHVTLGHGKTRTTVGLPGTGISYTQIDGAPQNAETQTDAGEVSILFPMILFALAFMVAVIWFA